MKFKLNTKVMKAEATAGGATLTVEPVKGGEPETLDADVILCSTGRVPFTEGLGLDNVGIKVTARGQVEVDDHFATSVPVGAPVLAPGPAPVTASCARPCHRRRAIFTPAPLRSVALALALFPLAMRFAVALPVCLAFAFDSVVFMRSLGCTHPEIVLATMSAGHLCHRRRRARSDACPQSRGGGHRNH
jgi:hypothetical protein